jgi:hypothetical protein
MKHNNETDRNYVEFQMEPEDTEQLWRIMNDVLPDSLLRFAGKNREYGNNATHDLGPSAQFVDLYRKVIKLRRVLWDGEDEAIFKSEPIDEVIDDLIAHLLLLKDERIVIKKSEARKWMMEHHVPAGDLRYETGMSLESSDDAWRDGDALRPPPNYKGQHAYKVVDIDDQGVEFKTVKHHTIRLANNDYERCPWYLGDRDHSTQLARCVGVMGHGENGDDEDYHISVNDEAWPVNNA